MSAEQPADAVPPGYPADLEQWVAWNRKTVQVRPVRPQDAELHRLFFARLDQRDLNPRTLERMPVVGPGSLDRLTRIYYDREMTFIVLLPDDGCGEALAVARSTIDVRGCAEFALAVRPDLKGRGLGQMLLGKLIRYYYPRQARELVGEARADDINRIELARAFWFEVLPATTPDMVKLRLTLGPTVIAG